MSISRVGVVTAKSSFHVHGVDHHHQVEWCGKYKRDKWLDAIAERVPVGAEIGMEACSSSYHWARGYRVKLVAAQFVKLYVKSNKNDRADSTAICEAMARPHMRFVTIKTLAQQDVQPAHRIRSELVRQCTAKANQISGLVSEYGLEAPTDIGRLRAALPCWLEDAENGLTDYFRILLADLAVDLRYLNERIAAMTDRIQRHALTDPVAKRLMTLRDVGTITASALAGALGDAKAFKCRRAIACRASASAATVTCVRYWYMAPERWCVTREQGITT